MIGVPIRAVIDVGSNSVLLLVAVLEGSTWKPVDERSMVTGLGEGVSQTGVLGELGMSRTLEALEECFAVAKSLGAQQVRPAATMAARMARNGPDFFARAAAQGTRVELLSGEREAALGFLSVANDPTFAHHPRISIVDPGGQSTELVTASNDVGGWSTLFQKSYALGTLALRASLLRDETPTQAQRLAAAQLVDETIGLEYRPHQAGRLVVLGATGTNLVTIRERLTAWAPERVHGQVLTYEEVANAFARLASMTDSERAAVPSIERGRERTIHIGALILERFMHALHVEETSVSVRGWRHALLEEDD